VRPLVELERLALEQEAVRVGAGAHQEGDAAVVGVGLQQIVDVEDVGAVDRRVRDNRLRLVGRGRLVVHPRLDRERTLAEPRVQAGVELHVRLVGVAPRVVLHRVVCSAAASDTTGKTGRIFFFLIIKKFDEKNALLNRKNTFAFFRSVAHSVDHFRRNAGLSAANNRRRTEPTETEKQREKEKKRQKIVFSLSTWFFFFFSLVLTRQSLLCRHHVALLLRRSDAARHKQQRECDNHAWPFAKNLKL
jgi:hypothetical protein